MNNLQLRTQTTDEGRILVFWKTGMQTFGCFEVSMPPMDDAAVAAELSVARLLLEERNACGHNKTGAGLRLEMSFGSIRKLQRHDSDKAHLVPYAMFLRTRFIGAEIEIRKNPKWATEITVEDPVRVEIPGPTPVLIEVGGIGPAEITTHAIDQYLDRFEAGVVTKRAWLRLTDMARDAKLAANTTRSALHDAKHRNAGSFAVNQARDCTFVVAPPTGLHDQYPKLVTVYRLNKPDKYK